VTPPLVRSWEPEFVRIFVELWQPVWWAAVAVSSNLGALHAPGTADQTDRHRSGLITTRSTASQVTRAASHTSIGAKNALASVYR
jgi:hypothetical protein